MPRNFKINNTRFLKTLYYETMWPFFYKHIPPIWQYYPANDIFMFSRLTLLLLCCFYQTENDGYCFVLKRAKSVCMLKTLEKILV